MLYLNILKNFYHYCNCGKYADLPRVELKITFTLYVLPAFDHEIREGLKVRAGSH